MNKVIDRRMKEARKTMKDYCIAAEALAQALCDHIKAEKGWECTWHLGDYEAGIDTITIEANCCCFDEACAYEMKLMNDLQDCNNYGPSFTVHCANHKASYDCDVHGKKDVEA
jgi:hypothetical protein